MGMASAESEGVGVGERERRNLLGRRRRSVWGFRYWAEGKMVFLLHKCKLAQYNHNPKTGYQTTPHNSKHEAFFCGIEKMK
jgi:hypothetical protein